MWQRFTQRARQVILQAQDEAGKLNSRHVGTEHLLLGLVRETDGSGARVLQQMGVGPEQVRAAVLTAISPTDDASPGEPKLTPMAKRVLELGAEEALLLRHNYIGTEHLLLALLHEKESISATVLCALGLNLEDARAQVLEFLDANEGLAAREPVTRRGGASDEFLEILQSAAQIRRNRGSKSSKSIEVKDVLLAICQSESAQILREAGVDVEALSAHLQE